MVVQRREIASSIRDRMKIYDTEMERQKRKHSGTPLQRTLRLHPSSQTLLVMHSFSFCNAVGASAAGLLQGRVHLGGVHHSQVRLPSGVTTRCDRPYSPSRPVPMIDYTPLFALHGRTHIR